MIDRGLPLRHQQNGVSVFRTRMAESVRLYSQLRQMFPKHGFNDNWRTAPTLVSDYRFLRRQRKYPKRDRQAAEVLQQLDEIAGFTSTHRQLLSALLSHSSGMYNLAYFQQEACKTYCADCSRASTARLLPLSAPELGLVKLWRSICPL